MEAKKFKDLFLKNQQKTEGFSKESLENYQEFEQSTFPERLKISAEFKEEVVDN